MNYWRNRHKRKGLLSTIFLHALAFIAFLFLGMTYEEPKPEEGIAINFGYTSLGKGVSQPIIPPSSSQVENVPEVPQEESNPSFSSEEIITQEIMEAPVIEDKQEKKQTSVKEDKKKEKLNKPSEELTQALENFLNNNEKEEGEGDSDQIGDEGAQEGKDSNELGRGGVGSQDLYSLQGRNVKNKPKYIPECNETGKVVVDIRVNKMGIVTLAEAGVKGSSNTHVCLLEKAKKAALKTTFEADHKAPPIQQGKIIYFFSIK